jgi:transcription elongation factor GreA
MGSEARHGSMVAALLKVTTQTVTAGTQGPLPGGNLSPCSMGQDIFLTKKGYEKLQRELGELKGPRRAAMAETIREARSHGDLKENAAYHEAKLNQSRLEGRIADLEKVLEVAKIVERPDVAGDIAHLGSRVVLHDRKWDEEIVVHLVGSFEADPGSGLVSIESPMGAALIGRVVGDEFKVDAPGGTQEFQVRFIEMGE